MDHSLAELALTLLVGAVIGFGFYKGKVPGGMLVGAIVGSSILNLGFGFGYMPRILKLCAQSLAGAFIGTMVTKKDLQQLKGLYRLLFLVLGSYIFINFAGGFAFCAISGVDLLTSFMCTIPGGLSDVPLIAADLGADLTPVVCVHFIRVFLGAGVFPSLVMLFTRSENEMHHAQAQQKSKAAHTIPQVAITLVLTAVFGFVGIITNIPAGCLVFSMLGVAAANVIAPKGFKACLPLPIKRIAQVLSGCYIGCCISRSSFSNIAAVIPAALMLMALFILNMLVTGRLLRRFCGVSLREGMLMLTPAGASDMALISGDMGINSPVLVVIQVLRLFVSDLFLPQICLFIANLVG